MRDEGVKVTANILSFGHQSAKTVVKLMVGLLGLSEFQAGCFIHGFRHASIGHTPPDHWKGNNEYYDQGFDVGAAWREAMPRKGERTR